MNIGTRIKQLRLQKNWSQETLAHELEVSRQAVAKWENQQSLPSTSHLLALCRAFGISMEQLTNPHEKPQDMKKKKRSFLIPATLSATFALASLITWILSQKDRLPDHIIGYGDAQTEIFLSGTPGYLYILFGLTALLFLIFLFSLFRWNYQRRKNHV